MDGGDHADGGCAGPVDAAIGMTTEAASAAMSVREDIDDPYGALRGKVRKARRGADCRDAGTEAEGESAALAVMRCV